MKEYKIRCTAISKIMAGEIGLTEVQIARVNELSSRRNGAGKPLTDNMNAELDKLVWKENNPSLPTGAKTYCKQWLKAELYNRNIDFKNSVIEKGLMVEMEGIELISEIVGINYSKNDEYFENDFMQGSPDIVAEIVRDVKSSWDLFTFPMFETEIPNEDYYYQLQGYMILTGIEKASLDYVLINTPKSLVSLDLKKLYYQSGGTSENWTPEDYELLNANYTFDDIPKEKRLKSFSITLDKTLDIKIKERVMLCRNYINSLTK